MVQIQEYVELLSEIGHSQKAIIIEIEAELAKSILKIIHMDYSEAKNILIKAKFDAELLDNKKLNEKINSILSRVASIKSTSKETPTNIRLNLSEIEIIMKSTYVQNRVIQYPD